MCRLLTQLSPWVEAAQEAFVGLYLGDYVLGSAEGGKKKRGLACGAWVVGLGLGFQEGSLSCQVLCAAHLQEAPRLFFAHTGHELR